MGPPVSSWIQLYCEGGQHVKNLPILLFKTSGIEKKKFFFSFLFLFVLAGLVEGRGVKEKCKMGATQRGAGTGPHLARHSTCPALNSSVPSKAVELIII